MAPKAAHVLIPGALGCVSSKGQRDIMWETVLGCLGTLQLITGGDLSSREPPSTAERDVGRRESGNHDTAALQTEHGGRATSPATWATARSHRGRGELLPEPSENSTALLVPRF